MSADPLLLPSPTPPRVPLWLKLFHTVFLAVLVPIYWRHYGPANFLWFSDIALFVLLLALWLENGFLASTQVLSVGALESAWVLDFLLALVLGKSPLGMSAYMFDPQRDLFVRGLSLFHLWLPPLLFWLVWRLDYHRRALIAQTVVCWVVLPVSYFVSTRKANINWVFGLGEDEPPEWLAAPRFLFGLMLFLPVCVYLPTHLLLSKLFLRRVRSSTMRALPFLLVTGAVMLLVLPFAAAAPEAPTPPVVDKGPDSDGDGLPDFQELHKYNTNPRKKDTFGAGVSDGDWMSRRESAYSVRVVVRIMPPFHLEAMNDDYQDARLLKQTKDYADLEVVLFPLNTNAQAITANPTWKRDYAGMKEYLAPGITTNWDESMRRDLLGELAAAGIDPDRLTDKELVERVSRWLMAASKYRNQFCTYYVHFPKGKPEVLPGLEKAFEKDRGDRRWSVKEQFEHELLGRAMFRNKTYGTCTSFAVYQATVLRALGIPTRMVVAIPVVDGSDEEQLDMLKKGMKHNGVRKVACEGALACGNSFTAHTFSEVFVGKRWRRLNYGTLGQNILDRHYLGLMIHVHTFRDLSEAGLAETWGRRYALGQRSKDFPRSNPYRCLEVADHFGKHARVPNPPVTIEEHTQVTITRAYWLGSKETPETIKSLPGWQPDPRLGRLMIHGEEWFSGRDHLQYKEFMRRADRAIAFRAKGRADVKGLVTMSFVTGPKDLREMEVLIPPEEFAKMVKGVAYTIHPVNGKPGYTWKVKDALTISRD